MTSSYLQLLQFRNDHGCRNTTVSLETHFTLCVCVCVHIFGRALTCPSPAGTGDVARVKHLLAAVNTEQRLTSFTLFDGSTQLSSVQAKSLVSTGKIFFSS